MPLSYLPPPPTPAACSTRPLLSVKDLPHLTLKRRNLVFGIPAWDEVLTVYPTYNSIYFYPVSPRPPTLQRKQTKFVTPKKWASDGDKRMSSLPQRQCPLCQHWKHRATDCIHSAPLGRPHGGHVSHKHTLNVEALSGQESTTLTEKTICGCPQSLHVTM